MKKHLTRVSVCRYGRTERFCHKPPPYKDLQCTCHIPSFVYLKYVTV